MENKEVKNGDAGILDDKSRKGKQKNTEKMAKQMGNRDFPLPDYTTVFKFKENPLIHDYRVREWVQQVFEISQIPEEKFAKVEASIHIVAYLYPLCYNIKKFENLIKIFLIIFVLDDHTECDWGYVGKDVAKCHDVWGQVVDGMNKLINPNTFVSMRGWKAYNHLFYSAFEDAFQDLNPVQRRRLGRLMQDYAFGSKSESKSINDNKDFKSLEDVMQIKRDSQTVYAVFDFMEYAYDICLSEEEWSDPTFKDIIYIARDAGVLAQDVGSFEKEYKEQDGRLNHFYNTIGLTMHLDKCSVEEAMKKIQNLREEYERKTKEAMNAFIADKNCTENQKRFLEGLDYLLGGNVYTTTYLNRYNHFEKGKSNCSNK